MLFRSGANRYNVDYSILGGSKVEPVLREIRNEMYRAGMTVESAKGGGAETIECDTVLVSIGGPLLFLSGTILFKHSFRGFLQLSHGVGIIALCVLAFFAGELSPLTLSILTTAIMIMVAVWESLSLRSPAAE